MNEPILECSACAAAWDMPLDPGDPCPHCGTVFVPEADRQEAASVEAPAALTEYSGTPLAARRDWVTIETFEQQHEAHMAAAVLEAAGIEADVSTDNMIIMHAPLTTARGVELRVAESDENAAHQALIDARTAAAAAADSPDDGVSAD